MSGHLLSVLGAVGLDWPTNFWPPDSTDDHADGSVCDSKLFCKILLSRSGLAPSADDDYFLVRQLSGPGLAVSVDHVVNVGLPGVESQVRWVAACWGVARVAGVEAANPLLSGGE